MTTQTIRQQLHRRGLRRGAFVWATVAALLFVTLLAAWKVIPLVWAISGLAGYIIALLVATGGSLVRCPACGFGLEARQVWRLQRGDPRLRINFCPHCGGDFDDPAAIRLPLDKPEERAPSA